MTCSHDNAFKVERVSTCEHVIQWHNIDILQLGLLVWANTDSIVIFLLLVCRRVHVLFAFFVIVCVSWCSTHVALCFRFFFLRLVRFSELSIFYCPFWDSLLTFIYLKHYSRGQTIVHFLTSFVSGKNAHILQVHHML